MPIVALSKLYQWLGPKSLTKIHLDISPTHSLIVTGVNKTLIWPQFLTD